MSVWSMKCADLWQVVTAVVEDTGRNKNKVTAIPTRDALLPGWRTARPEDPGDPVIAFPPWRVCGCRPLLWDVALAFPCKSLTNQRGSDEV